MGPARDRLLVALGHVLHVRRSELERTLRMTGLAVVLGCAMYTAFNGTQAIFLDRAGPPAYPLFFVVLALSVWPAIALQSFAIRQLGVARAFRYTLLLNAVIAVPLFVAYRLGESYRVSFVAYVVYSVAFEIVMLQFWTFVSQYFNILEGKRIYPVIAAGSGLGYIFAGAVTSGVARATGGPELLMFVWAAGAAASGLIAYRAERRLYRPPVEDEVDELHADVREAHRRRGVLRSITESLDYLRVSRLVLALVLLGTVLLVVMRVSDYLVAVIFVRSTRNLEELTVLIGNAWMLSYVVQLFLGLWVTPWLLAKAGVKNAILSLPVATLIGFALVAFAPALGPSLFLFVVRNGIQTGVDDPAQNVLGGALPEQVGPRLKVLQENLVLPGSAVLAGVGLLVIGFFFGTASALFLAILGLFVCLAFVVAALWVRSLYVNAIYQRLRAHTLSLSDLELALGRPSAQDVEELKAFIRGDNPELREFAAAALAQLSPDNFRRLAADLARSPDAGLRRLAYQLSPPGGLDRGLIESGAADPDPWVVAAAALAGAGVTPPWVDSRELLGRLYSSGDAGARAAGVWAAASGGGERAWVAESLSDPEPKVRLEAIRSFARLKGQVPGVAAGLLACLEDGNLEVRRAALRQAIRWKPPAAQAAAYAEALLKNLAFGDGGCRRLAGEAIVLQAPSAMERLLELLNAGTPVAVAAIEPLYRSGKAELLRRAAMHIEQHLDTALESAGHAGRLAALARVAGSGAEDFRFAALRVSLEDYQQHSIELALAALRALHEKRGFARVEQALRSGDPESRAEAVETLINFGPARLVEPLVRLVDPESFDGAPARPLSEEEVSRLEAHPDAWVRRAAEAVSGRAGESMKDLIALKKVPLFATLTLEQLNSIDRLMVTRRYHAGEHIFKWGDLSSELYVILEGEVRIHRDDGLQQVTLAKLGPSSVMGEMAPFTDQPRSAGAQATVTTVTRVLRKDRLKAILHEHPEVLLEVIRNLSQRLVVANEQLEAAARSQAEAAEAAPAKRPARTALASRSRSR